MNKDRMRTACVLMTGPDVRMDQYGNIDRPANPLPPKCAHCTFPNLDFVAQPYLLAKGFASPAETSPAEAGNVLVRERVRRILEAAVPGACVFYPTADRKTQKPTPWWLAVPQHQLASAMPKAKRPFCSKCGEPKVWVCAMGAVWTKMLSFDSHGVDVFKTKEWYCGTTAEDDFVTTNGYRAKDNLPPLPWSFWDLDAPPHKERWTRVGPDRDLYFSVRLEQLLKRLKVKGQLVRLLNFADVKCSEDDEAWIAEKLRLLAGQGPADAPKAPGGKEAKAARAWFQLYLRKHAIKPAKKFDFDTVEKKHKLVLPPDYKEFISTVGPQSFEDLLETEGFTARVLPPAKLDFKSYRRGKVPDLDEESAQVDGIMFASTEHGDAFVFDVSAKDAAYPVYWYDHEQNTLEAFAPNFAECVKRFAQKN